MLTTKATKSSELSYIKYRTVARKTFPNDSVRFQHSFVSRLPLVIPSYRGRMGTMHILKKNSVLTVDIVENIIFVLFTGSCSDFEKENAPVERISIIDPQ